MSVKVHVLFTVHNDVDKFKAKASEVVKASKRSAGCISSGLYQELGGEHFSIIETWESEADCDKDTAAEHVTSFLREMGDNISVDVKKFSPV